MKIDKQITIVEKAMCRAYSEEPSLPEISSSWQSSLMTAIKNELPPEEAEIKMMEKKFLYFSWVAASIAAALIIISGVVYYSPERNTLDNDITALYADNTLDHITTAMVNQ